VSGVPPATLAGADQVGTLGAVVVELPRSPGEETVVRSDGPVERAAPGEQAVRSNPDVVASMAARYGFGRR
jgi:hypothetical protein